VVVDPFLVLLEIERPVRVLRGAAEIEGGIVLQRLERRLPPAGCADELLGALGGARPAVEELAGDLTGG
jgi:hypothetical protein